MQRHARPRRFSSAAPMPLLCAMVLISGEMAWADAPPASMTTDDAKKRLASVVAKIHDWYLEYESNAWKEADRPPGAYVHRIVAGSAPDRYFHWSTHGCLAYSWRDDPFQQRLTVAQSQLVNEFPADRTYFVLQLPAKGSLPGTAPEELAFWVFGWWVLDQRPAPQLTHGAVAAWRDIAQSPKYTMRPSRILLDGKWCHVLEYAGRDELWLDFDRGCVLLARNIYDPATGALLQRITQSGHREVIPGVWVASEFTNTLFGKPDGSGKQDRVVDAVFKVLDIKVNEPFQSDLFTFRPATGSIRLFEDGHFEQTTSGGTDHLDYLVQWYRGLGAAQPSAGGWPYRVEAIIEYTVMGCCVMVIAILAMRGRNRAGRPPSNMPPAATA